MASKFPQALCWVDLETTTLPVKGDYSGVHLLEIAVIITDFDLNPQVGYEEVVKLTSESAASLRANEYVKSMHTANGLIKACAREATKTMAEVEEEIIQMLQTQTSFDKGEFMIAGSGVAAFDHPFIKQKMPKFDAWLAYFPFDIGVERRVSKILAGRAVVNPITASYGDDKLHRAMADVKAHIQEAQSFREFYRRVA